MTGEQVVVVILGALALTWWVEAAPLYILAGKRGLKAPAMALVPLFQLEVLARTAGAWSAAGSTAVAQGARYSDGWAWERICEESGVAARWGRLCSIPGIHFAAQWVIALRAPCTSG